VDKVLGNVIKLDRHGYVGRAYHGRARLDRETRRATYRVQRLGQERERFTPVDTLFALPEVTLFARLVELLDAEPGLWPDGAPTYAQAWQDVRDCIDESHRDGSLKDQIKADPARYIQRDPDLARTLHKLRSAGKRLFVLTNSYYAYTDAVMTFLLDGCLPSYPDWRSYFDWVVVGGTKPAFFTETRDFQELAVDGEHVGPPRSDIQRGKIYQGGNQQGLQASLDVHPDEVLYVGDHIYGDIVKSKKSSGWRTALVVQELEEDLQVRRARDTMIREVASLHELRASLVREASAERHLERVVGKLTAGSLEGEGLTPAEAEAMLSEAREGSRDRFDRLRRYEQETSATLEARSAEVDEAFNPYWGSVFSERHDTSRFGAQVEFYACIYTSRVSNFLYVSPARYFHSPHGSLPHWTAASRRPG
jgi:5'-nucleotidase